MSSEPPAWVHSALSLPRFVPYIAAASGDTDMAVRLYWWNIEISGAFYGPLHCLERGLRNALHRQLRTLFGRSDWWAGAPLTPSGLRMIAEVEAKLRRRVRPGSRPTTWSPACRSGSGWRC
jgi:hypothetical protein